MLQKCNFDVLPSLKSVSSYAFKIETVNWRLEFDQSRNLSLLCSDSSNLQCII